MFSKALTSDCQVSVMSEWVITHFVYQYSWSGITGVAHIYAVRVPKQQSGNYHLAPVIKSVFHAWADVTWIAFSCMLKQNKWKEIEKGQLGCTCFVGQKGLSTQLRSLRDDTAAAMHNFDVCWQKVTKSFWQVVTWKRVDRTDSIF